VLNGKPQPLLGTWMDGDKLGFSFIDSENTLRSAQMKVAGSAMTGTLSGIRKTPLTGSKR
jgi:hypothetical protein